MIHLLHIITERTSSNGGLDITVNTVAASLYPDTLKRIATDLNRVQKPSKFNGQEVDAWEEKVWAILSDNGIASKLSPEWDTDIDDISFDVTEVVEIKR